MSEDRPNTSSSEEQQPSTSTGAATTRKPSNRSRARKQTETPAVAAGESGASSTSESGPSVDRAEKIVEEWTKRAEQMGTQIGHQFIRLFARAREEAEDIVAEAQALRRNEGTEQSESER